MLDLAYRLTNPEMKALVELAELITPIACPQTRQ
jgi:hypothetical protein